MGLTPSFGEVSSILAIPSIIEPWFCTQELLMVVAVLIALLSHASCYSEYPTRAKLCKKSILSTEMTVKLLELKKPLQGCFPFVVLTLL